MEITEETLNEILRRLDAQAAAIRSLREWSEQVKRVLPAEGRPSDRERHREVDRTGDESTQPWHPYVPSSLCVMCNRPKEPGRTALTCVACTTRRNNILLGEVGTRAEITRSACECCGAGFKPQTRFLCPPCSAGHRVWTVMQSGKRAKKNSKKN